MPTAVIRHVGITPRQEAPGGVRPVTVVSRQLETDEATGLHTHTWGQFTYALDGVLRVSAANSSWIVPPLRAIWIAAGTVHGVSAAPDGSVKAIHIKTGGFLGFGGKLVAIPEGRFTKSGDNIQLGITADEVSKLPEVKEQS